MKIVKLATTLLFAGATAAMAGSAADTDGDGLLSWDEVAAMWPEVSADAFAQADGDQSGMLDAEELAAAQEAGLIPAEDG